MMTLKQNRYLFGVMALFILLSLIIFIQLNNKTTPLESTNETHVVVTSELTSQHYVEDYLQLYSLIETNYPYLELKQRTHELNWLDRKEAVLEELKTCSSNQAFLSIIAEEVTALQNRHTHLLNPNEVIEYHNRFANVSFMAELFTSDVADANRYWSTCFSFSNRRYSVEILYDRGEYIVVNRQGGVSTPYGDNLSVTKINGIPVHDAIRDSKDFIDIDPIRNQQYVWAITPSTFTTETVFTLVHPNGTETTKTISSFYGSPKTDFYPAPNLVTRQHLNHSTAYIYIKTFDPDTMQTLTPKIHRFLMENENLDYLIIDIRGNTGGAFHSWITAIVEPLLTKPTLHEYYLAYPNHQYIKQFHQHWLTTHQTVPQTSFTQLPPEITPEEYTIYNFSTTYTPSYLTNYTGKILLLTDRTVYSAAEGFTNFCKQTGFATIIGTYSGGDGFFIWPNFLVLPNSKLVIVMTSSISLDNKGRANEEVRTTPEIIIETSITDHEALIEHVLELIVQGKIE